MKEYYSLYNETRNKHLWTRGSAIPLREKAENILSDLSNEGVLWIDLENIEAFDYSFASEFFGKLIINTQSFNKNKFIILDNLSKKCF